MHEGREVVVRSLVELSWPQPQVGQNSGDYMRIMKRPSKFLKDLLLEDADGNTAEIVGIESDAGAARVYVASKESLADGLVVRHYIRTEEIVLTPELRETLGMPPEPKPAVDEEDEGEEWKNP